MPTPGSRWDSSPSAPQLLPGTSASTYPGFRFPASPGPLSRSRWWRGEGTGAGAGLWGGGAALAPLGGVPLTPAPVGRRSSCPMEHPCIPVGTWAWETPPGHGPGVLGVPGGRGRVCGHPQAILGGCCSPPTPARLPLDIHRFSPCQERGRLTRQNSSQGPIPPPPPCPPSLGPGAPQNPWEVLRERRLSSPSPNTCHRYGAGWGLWGGGSAAGKPPAPCAHAGLSPVGAEGARGKG